MSVPELKMDINRALEVSGQVADKLREGKQARFIEDGELAIDTIRDVAIWAMQVIQDKVERHGQGVEVIVSKLAWERLKTGVKSESISTFRESELHHVFGDYPEKEIIRLRLEEI